MDDKSRARTFDQRKAYFFVGITFLAVAVASIFSSMNAMWVAFFVLGITFVIIGASTKRSTDES